MANDKHAFKAQKGLVKDFAQLVAGPHKGISYKDVVGDFIGVCKTSQKSAISFATFEPCTTSAPCSQIPPQG